MLIVWGFVVFSHNLLVIKVVGFFFLTKNFCLNCCLEIVYEIIKLLNKYNKNTISFKSLYI